MATTEAPTTYVGAGRSPQGGREAAHGPGPLRDNLERPRGCSALAVVRSPVAHARITQVDVSTAARAARASSRHSRLPTSRASGPRRAAVRWPVTEDIEDPRRTTRWRGQGPLRRRRRRGRGRRDACACEGRGRTRRGRLRAAAGGHRRRGGSWRTAHSSSHDELGNERRYTWVARRAGEVDSAVRRGAPSRSRSATGSTA